MRFRNSGVRGVGDLRVNRRNNGNDEVSTEILEIFGTGSAIPYRVDDILWSL